MKLRFDDALAEQVRDAARVYYKDNREEFMFTKTQILPLPRSGRAIASVIFEGRVIDGCYTTCATEVPVSDAANYWAENCHSGIAWIVWSDGAKSFGKWLTNRDNTVFYVHTLAGERVLSAS